jgi:hypothetical protein
VLFAIPRTAGWLAHWEELMVDPERRIARPRQIYLGPEELEYVPIEDRLGKAQNRVSSRCCNGVRASGFRTQHAGVWQVEQDAPRL